MMLYLLIAPQLADIATTHYALKSGSGTEANPVLRKLFERPGHGPVSGFMRGHLTNQYLYHYEHQP